MDDERDIGKGYPEEQPGGAGDLFLLIDPDSPAFSLDEFNLVLDALHKKKIAKRPGAGLTLQMTDQAHATLLLFKFDSRWPTL